MKNVIEFIKSDDIKSLGIYTHLKCSDDEINILQYLTKQYIIGNDNLLVVDILSEFYDIKEFEHLKKHLSYKKSTRTWMDNSK